MDCTLSRHRLSRTLIAALVIATAPVLALAQTSLPTFQKSFNPATIGPGSVTTLRFDIANPATSPALNLAFSDTMPSGVVVAAAPNIVSTCGAVTAAAGGSTISLGGGNVGGQSACTVAVDVTSSTPGAHTNTSGDLTSSAGNSGGASADLVVDLNRPGFSKSFSPAAVVFGGRSTLTFTIDNSANASQAFQLVFTDTLPTGMTVASPANASTTCTGGAVAAAAGGGSISFGPALGSLSSVASGATCTVSVDVVASSVGTLTNISGELTSTPGGATVSSGKASASLTVTAEQLVMTKSFTNDPVAPGGSVTLQFTIRNLNRRSSATAISFSDDLDATLSGLVALTLPLADPCGPGSSLAGIGVISLTGGTLDPSASCTFSVALQVPGGAPSGAYPNTTTTITADIDGSPVVGNPASDVLFVQPVPILTKSFVDDPVSAGGSVTLEFTVTNASATSPATDITFGDVFVSELPSASAIPASGFCGAGAQANYQPRTNFNPSQLTVTGASLAAGDSCTFSLTLDVDPTAGPGTYPNTTSTITATVGGASLTGSPAHDDLLVVAAPRLTKEFIDDPVAAGGTATLRFTLSYSQNAPGDASDVTFTDDLDAVLSGLVATGLPAADVCGAGSQLSGTTSLTLTGGLLSPGETCTFDVGLDIPAAATPGIYLNTTSVVAASVLGVAANSPPASDSLRIAGLALTKSFIDDPVLPGATTTLRFTLENTSPASQATAIQFLDDLDDAVHNMAVVTALPLNDICGVGSSLSATAGGSLLIFDGGSLAPGTSCTFDVTLQVPAATEPDSYPSVTTGFSALIDGSQVFFDNASDQLVVDSDFLTLTKEFVDDPAGPGEAVTLHFEIANRSTSGAVTDIAFTDDLDAALSGLVSTSGTLNDICGVGSALSDVNILSFTGGSLDPGGSCQFDVSLQVPILVTLGDVAINTTSEVTGNLGGLQVTGGPATDELRINALTFSKVFGGDVEPGQTAVLTFTIGNASATDSASGLSFIDDLEAMMPGMEAVGLPVADVCGAGSEIAGTSSLILSGGTIPPLGSCTFSIDVVVPETTSPGFYLNTTSDLRQGGFPAAPAAAALLEVLDIPPVPDADNDGVLDDVDVCLGTEIPEAVPTRMLLVFHYALTDGDTTFDSRYPAHWPFPIPIFTTTDTAGCSCDQIIDEVDLPPGLAEVQRRFGCSVVLMKLWVLYQQANPDPDDIDALWNELLRSEGVGLVRMPVANQ